MLNSAINTLVVLGLSESEAKAYVVLLEESPSIGYRVADCSGVPRSEIFGVLESLEQRGAVVSTNGDGPRIYSAVNAEVFLNKVRLEYQSKIASFRASLTGSLL